MSMRTLWGTATDRGRVRSLNEDSLLAYPPVFLVADGMGGHDAGDVASRAVVEEFSLLVGRDTTNADEIHDCVQRAGLRIRTALAGQTAGTTVAGVAIATHDGGDYWLVFNVGDSRVYRLSEGHLEQISVDHSVVQELVDQGAISQQAARVHPERHVITRAVGTGGAPEPDYWMLPAGTKDRIMICSDGLTSELDDAQIHAGLTSFADPSQAADWLVEAAVDAGGRDNVTVVVVDVATAWTDLGANDVTVTRDSTRFREQGQPTAEIAESSDESQAAAEPHGAQPWLESMDGRATHSQAPVQEHDAARDDRLPDPAPQNGQEWGADHE